MRRCAAAAVLWVLTFGFGAAAADPPASTIQNPDWLRRPRAEDLLTVWPKDAWRKGLGGKATIGCEVNVQGVLVNCKTLSEEPAGAGFGGAALALTPQFLMRPQMRDGKPVSGGQVRIPITFRSGYEGSAQRGPSNMMLSTPIIDAAILWREAPTYADVAAAYPAKARTEAVAGRANLACNFTEDGALKGCSTVTENPRGYDFAKAAKTLAEKFRGPTKRQDGKSIKGVQVQLPVTFSPDMLKPEAAVVGQPKWAALPPADVMWASYPAAAKQAGVKMGRVVLACIVQQEGKLEGCKVESQDPASHGFGEAALSMTPYFRMRTWTMEGLPTVGGQVRIPIRYEDTATAAAPPSAKP